jgi:hypothetical protein
MQDKKKQTSRRLVVVDGNGSGVTAVNVTKNADGTYQLDDQRFASLEAIPGVKDRAQTCFCVDYENRL